MDTTGATAATCLMVAPGGNYINHHQRGCNTPTTYMSFLSGFSTPSKTKR